MSNRTHEILKSYLRSGRGLTDWIGGVLPVRIGVYEVAAPEHIVSLYPFGRWFMYFDGTQWSEAKRSIELAYQFRHQRAFTDPYFWRGITESRSAQERLEMAMNMTVEELEKLVYMDGGNE